MGKINEMMERKEDGWRSWRGRKREGEKIEGKERFGEEEKGGRRSKREGEEEEILGRSKK